MNYLKFNSSKRNEELNSILLKKFSNVDSL